MKHLDFRIIGAIIPQPPSGGCVLKQKSLISITKTRAAAFRRLCVETSLEMVKMNLQQTAAFRRLCVETSVKVWSYAICTAAAFRRLCVETLRLIGLIQQSSQPPSGGCVLKLGKSLHDLWPERQPPSGGCVLKQPIIRKLFAVFCSRLQAAVC